MAFGLKNSQTVLFFVFNKPPKVLRAAKWLLEKPSSLYGRASVMLKID